MEQPASLAQRLTIDCEIECERICSVIRHTLTRRFKKRGIVLGLSGGIDSSVVGALCVRAVGADRVFGLLMPEKDSSSETNRLSREIVDFLGIDTLTVDITNTLESLGCYRERDAAIRRTIPEYDDGYTCKICLPSVLDDDRFRLFSVTVESPEGEITTRRLSMRSYLGVLSASNFKQRVRKMIEYFHADRLNFAVAGTPNLLEYDQGFFVKLGDGSADIKPIAHLYKTQVYQMAGFLNIPSEILTRPPTTDTYSMSQSQEEFFFSLPYQKMDLCLFAINNNIPAKEVARAVDLTEEQVHRVFKDIESKRSAAQYLHASPILIEEDQRALPESESD